MLKKISVFVALFIILAAFSVQLKEKRWDTDFGVVQGDVKGYYAYLPLLFIYNDIKIQYYEQYSYKNSYRIWCAELPNGNRHIKYTMGMAMLYAPFFLIAHILANITDYPADGFSLPYQVMLAMSSLFFLALGIFFLRKLLRMYFNDLTVALTLLVIYLGTNLFYYYTQRMSVSHGYSFALITVFLYASIMWLKNHKLKWAVVSGISGGLMVLVRPVDLLFFIFPLLYGAHSWRLLRERFKLLRTHSLHVTIVFLLSFLVILPQLIYWNHITGRFVFDSYANDHFYFLKPNIFRAMFSYRNGWLVYSPVMVFSIVGIFQSRRQLPQFFTPLVLIVPVYIYVIASWWCWWYVGFGNRAFINLYPFLSIAMAVFIAYTLRRRKAIKLALLIVLSVFVMFNLFQTYQMSTGAIHWGSMSKAAYWDSFGRLRPSQLFPTYLSWVDLEETKKGKYVVSRPDYQPLIDEYFDFESKPESKYIVLNTGKAETGTSLSGEESIISPKNKKYALNVRFPLMDAGEVYVTVWIKNAKECALVLKGTDSIPFYKSSKEYIDSKKDWKRLNIFARFSGGRKPDSLLFYVNNAAKNEIRLDDLHITTRKVSYHLETIECNIR